jgi:TonB family protein
LFILDGTRISQSKFDQLQYPAIDSVKIIKGEEAIRLYGEKGKYGVVRMVSNPKADQRISACQNSQVFGDSEQMPEFPGGELALRKYITTELQYPAEARKEWVQGKVFVTFRISVMGKVENPRIARSVHPLLDAEALRLVGQMPDWTPGFYGRKPFRASYTIPVKFSLEDPQPPKRIIRTPPVKADSGTVKELMEVYSVIESPEFPGGEAGLKRFLEKELTYPEQAKKDSIQGCVWVSFVVNSKGVAENVKIEQGVYPLLDAEVLRVFNQIPATWKPGIQNGRKVAGVVFLSPVQFVLN